MTFNIESKPIKSCADNSRAGKQLHIAGEMLSLVAWPISVFYSNWLYKGTGNSDLYAPLRYNKQY